jgi:hypothetical protein
MREDVVGAEAVLQHGGLRGGEPELLPPGAGAGARHAPSTVAVVRVLELPGLLVLLPASRHTRGAATAAIPPLPARRRRRGLPVTLSNIMVVALQRQHLAEQLHRPRPAPPSPSSGPAAADAQGQVRADLLGGDGVVVLLRAAGRGEAGHGGRSISGDDRRRGASARAVLHLIAWWVYIGGWRGPGQQPDGRHGPNYYTLMMRALGPDRGS